MVEQTDIILVSKCYELFNISQEYRTGRHCLGHRVHFPFNCIQPCSECEAQKGPQDHPLQPLTI